MKKTLAMLLAAVMLLAVIPFAAVNAEASTEPDGAHTEDAHTEDAPIEKALPEAHAVSLPEDYPPKDKGEERSVQSAFCQDGTYINFTMPYSQWIDKGTYIESGNIGQPASNAQLNAQSLNMSAGETIIFSYWYEMANGDVFIFAVNGSQVFNYSGTSGGWIWYTWTAPSDGTYNLVWQYVKNSSGNYGADCVRLSNLEYSLHKSYYREYAALKPGSGLLVMADDYSNADYQFFPGTDGSAGHPLFLMSSNYNAQYSSCKIKFTCTLPQTLNGTYKLKFDYAFNAGPLHRFDLEDNGILIYNKYGDAHPNMDWHSVSCDITTGGVHEFVFEYRTTSVVPGVENKLYLDNIELVQSDNYFDRWNGINSVNASTTQSRLNFNTPKGSEGFDMIMDLGEFGGIVVNNNYGIDNSTSYFETYVNMAAGETLEFNYNVNSEGYDKFNFYANGERKLSTGGWIDNDYTTKHYTFTAPATKGYLFRWEYKKDQSYTRGLDRVLISGIKYTGTRNNTLTLDNVLNVSGGNLHFEGDGAQFGKSFIPYDCPNVSYNAAVSGNRYYENSASMVRTTITNVKPGDQISFQYIVSAESYDKFYFLVNGQSVFSPAESFYGDWRDVTYTFQTSGRVELTWKFIKDGSVNLETDNVMIDNVSFTSGPPLSLDLINSDDTDRRLHFTTGDGNGIDNQGFDVGLDSFGYYAYSTNDGYNNSIAYMEATAILNTYSRIDFIYYIDSEDDYDWFKFYVNGTEVYRDSGEDHTSFEWVTPSSGTYTFRWEYAKDGSTHVGGDNVVIRDVKIEFGPSEHLDLNLINGSGTLQPLQFTTGGEYPFDCMYVNGRYTAYSTNYGVDNSVSYMTATAALTAGKTLSFSYMVDSETNYDLFRFYVNNSLVYTDHGYFSDTYTWTAPSSGTYTFRWEYYKDGSTSVDGDCVHIWNVLVGSGGSGGGVPGDTDGNGTVNMVDAVMALRHAMSLTTLTAEQRARADIDGNGTVNMVDAVTILRRSMGIA
ncbi:MAG: dockerin type I repeat-containing protein [Clostridia bacterium]|nr:dockerin type I repeat-containing protein [Clostridia bacterium]